MSEIIHIHPGSDLITSPAATKNILSIDPSQFPPDDHRHELTEGLDQGEGWFLYRCIFCTFELRLWEAS